MSLPPPPEGQYIDPRHITYSREKTAWAYRCEHDKSLFVITNAWLDLPIEEQRAQLTEWRHAHAHTETGSQ